MNVGDNYNRPKVLALFKRRESEGLGRLQESKNGKQKSKAASSRSNARLVLKKYMAICWEADTLSVISREDLQVLKRTMFLNRLLAV